MKKMLVFMMAFLVFTWGCASIVYVSQESGKGQLMTAPDGSPLNPSPLFVTAFDDSMPSVSHDGNWVAFKRVVGGMDRIVVRQTGDASGTTEKDLAQGTRPRWAPAGDWVLFRNQGKIYRIRPDGTSLAQITNPGVNVSDNFGHGYWNANTVVFGRGTGTGPGQFVGLYLQEIATATVTPILSDFSMPAISHDGTTMACETRIYLGMATVHYIYLFGIPSLQYLYSIQFIYAPGTPSITGVSGVAFSSDDSRLFFSAIPPNETKREIYSIKLDGSDLKRLTSTVWDEFYPEGYK
ncbi:MAG TPA: hypothetical protein VF336_07395 [Syntrophales bacterium]